MASSAPQTSQCEMLCANIRLTQTVPKLEDKVIKGVSGLHFVAGAYSCKTFPLLIPMKLLSRSELQTANSAQNQFIIATFLHSSTHRDILKVKYLISRLKKLKYLGMCCTH